MISDVVLERMSVGLFISKRTPGIAKSGRVKFLHDCHELFFPPPYTVFSRRFLDDQTSLHDWGKSPPLCIDAGLLCLAGNALGTWSEYRAGVLQVAGGQWVIKKVTIIESFIARVIHCLVQLLRLCSSGVVFGGQVIGSYSTYNCNSITIASNDMLTRERLGEMVQRVGLAFKR